MKLFDFGATAMIIAVVVALVAGFGGSKMLDQLAPRADRCQAYENALALEKSFEHPNAEVILALDTAMRIARCDEYLAF